MSSPESPRTSIPWGRIVAEAVLIFASVYIAIVLESASQDRKDARQAREALGQVLAELREDQRDLVEIRAQQERVGRQYDRSIRWLSSPSTIPGDSLTRALIDLGVINRTLYHRRAAWTTMVAAGQLADLKDPELVTLLGNLYENFSRRFEDNGAGYDYDVSRISLEWIPEVWDSVEHQLRRPQEAGLLRQRLQFMQVAWNLYYLDLLGEYEERVLVIIDGIEAHFERHGIETSPQMNE
ncbi:MAG: hypothetical protein ACC682_00225 [Gemmatimonadota bacterium]